MIASLPSPRPTESPSQRGSGGVSSGPSNTGICQSSRQFEAYSGKPERHNDLESGNGLKIRVSAVQVRLCPVAFQAQKRRKPS